MSFDLEFAVSSFLKVLLGSRISFLITGVSLLVSLPLGLLLGSIRLHKVKIISPIIDLIVSFLRGTPLVVQIFIVFSGFPRVLNQIGHGFGLQIDFFGWPPIVYAFIVFSLNLTAILSETFRSALGSVDKSQLEAAEVVGLSSFHSFRLIILPQAMVLALPNMYNAILGMFRSTSLVYIMGIADITGTAKAIAGVGYKYIEVYLDVFIIYLILCYLIQQLFIRLENKFSAYKVG